MQYRSEMFDRIRVMTGCRLFVESIVTLARCGDRELNAILTLEQQSQRKSRRQGKWEKNG